MSVNGISFLPDDLKAKEAEVKSEAKEIKKAPSFKFHVPGKEEASLAPTAPVSATGPDISFANAQPIENKGVFKIVKKEEKPVTPLATPPSAPPKPKLKPDMWLKYFEPGAGLFKKIKTNFLNSKTTTPEYNWVITSEYWLKLRALLLVLLVLLVVFVVGCLSIKSYHNGRVPQYNSIVNNLNSLNQELRNRDENREAAMKIVDQAMVIELVMAERASWTKLFNFLERKTLNNVSYLDFQIVNDTMVNLTVVAPTYSVLAQQMQLFEETAGIKTVDIGEAKVAIDKNNDAKEITSEIKLILTPDFWQK